MLGPIESGHPYYGCHVGILVFNGVSPRVPGDAGHAETFRFPVDYEVVDGCFARLADGDESVRSSILEGAKRLRSRGVRIIAGDCGLMGELQNELGEVGMLAAGASLCLIPTLWRMLGCRGKVGVITGHTDLLSDACLSACGCDDIPLVIQGMQFEPHFRETVIGGGLSLDPLLMERDVVSAARKLLERDADVRAIVLECSNLATYSWAVVEATGLPTFDLVSAVNLMESGLYPTDYGVAM